MHPSRDHRTVHDHAIVSLYQAASGMQPWTDALATAATLFRAERADLAVLEVAAERRFLLTASSADTRDRSLPVSPPSDQTMTAILRLALDTRSQAFAAIRWPRGMPRDDALTLELQVWAGHLQVALELARRLATLSSPASLIHTLIDALPNATWIITSDGAILHANSAAVSMAGRHGPLATPRSDRLVLRDGRQDRSLRTLLQQLSDPATPPQASLELRTDRAASPLLLHVRRQDPESPLATARFVVSLFSSESHALPPITQVSRSLGLTEAEARVAALLADGHSPDTIAQLNGTSITTVRTQLAQVFRKLGVARQNDVVRILCQNHSLWRLMAA